MPAFAPAEPAKAAEALEGLAGRLASASTAGWGGEPGAGAALGTMDPRREPIVSYVGKLIVSKGVDLLLAAWPLVVDRVPGARLCVVGFGTYRDTLHAFVDALAAGDLPALRQIAAQGREAEGGPAGELTYLAAFLDGLEGDRRDAYLRTAPAAAAGVVFTGRLEHDDLPALLPACRAQVVPSTFPEAFGMVAAEAACCGALPLSAAHSGLAEVTAVLEEGVDPELRPLLSFERGPGAVEEIASKLAAWLLMDDGERARGAEALARTARARFGWEAVAEGVIATAEGRLEALPGPTA